MARILVTGATGYIGGRLVPALLAEGHEVRCLARTPAKLDGRTWRSQVEVVAGDVTDRASLDRAVEGIDVVYWLVHAMGGGGDFAEDDRRAACRIRDAAAAGGVERLVYLGGLGDDSDPSLSPHLASRQEVGRLLAEGPVPVTEIRAAVIIGSGSASFEMLRHLTDVLPVMVTPRWVDTRCQPIAIRDVLRYLVAVAGDPRAAGRVIEIGGADVLTYRQMMDGYARLAGLRRRLVVPVPFLSPGLSSHWLNLVTPLPIALARHLVESLVNEVVVRRPVGRDLYPEIEPVPFDEAVLLALRRIADLDVATTWADAGSAAPRPGAGPTAASTGGRDPAAPQPSDPDWAGGTVLTDERRVTSRADPGAVYRVVTGIGGARGWYGFDRLWDLRGLLDKLAGGPGARRGRRHPDQLAVGDALDFWRVDALEPDGLVRLRAEMRLPGHAWLEWRLTRRADGGTDLLQRARFHPRGVTGRAYWYGLVPFHALIFGRLARRLVAAAEAG